MGLLEAGNVLFLDVGAGYTVCLLSEIRHALHL